MTNRPVAFKQANGYNEGWCFSLGGYSGARDMVGLDKLRPGNDSG